MKSTSKSIGAKSGGERPSRKAYVRPGRQARFLAQSGAAPIVMTLAFGYRNRCPRRKDAASVDSVSRLSRRLV
jgi:hypothetical protein